MTSKKLAGPVIAGIDGSDAARDAAVWAADEATARGVPLRLIYATKRTHDSTDDYTADVQRARTSLQEARAAVEATGRPVTIETAIVDGPPATALIDLSAHAGMVCVGSVGIGRYARSVLGSVATDVAEKARCPVAVIRPRTEDVGRDITWIIVAVDDSPGNDAVVDQAMREATLRHAPVLALGERDSGREPGPELDETIRKYRQRYPDVHVYAINDHADVVHFLRKHDERVLLAVIGSTDAADVAQIIGGSHLSKGHPIFHRAHSSALIVRG
ncbi:universal stress protein UspA-like protein [Mycolicibacterium chubuense NBB4]|uniref:Universal stress protein UspA-like protein n=1 Tax=Mycolicibacterium chubuense (strain NBB4) TaxID=710421 RepID=I4BG91_MYCCN|nr:universal stress protein [Mycolicibacterium chubuense]AFM16298.1 universal stress protein UspA-like protein [Mycolicibacterium chubuense NBB4]